MGKDLKGKELGVGISQRKDGLYTARFVGRNGKREQKYFKKLQECRQWLADAQFEDGHGGISASGDMSVDAWFEYWITEIKGSSIRLNTIKNRRTRYEKNIKEYIGNMMLDEVRPMHCQNILNRMADTYRNSTIELTRVTMHGLFESALENEIILRNPVTKTVKCTTGKDLKEKRVLSCEEQKIFMEAAKGSAYYCQYAFVLQTGIRVGELTGLKWEDVDFQKRILHIQRTAEYHSPNDFRVGNPKSKSGNRNIPLSQEAIKVLESQKEKNGMLKVFPIQFSDYIFLNKNGKPAKRSVYDDAITSICSKLDMERFSMHTLRHTFATRCIEAGMKPKTLQAILGHSKIAMTMDLYVHITEEEKAREFEGIEKALRII